MTEKKPIPLEFEKPLELLAQQIEALEKQIGEHPELENDIDRLKEQYEQLRRSL